MSDSAKGGKITLYRRADAEIIEKKSRFIGHAAPVKDEAEAQLFIAEMKKKYSDATHNVYAYYINNGAAARCSDDGEPQGSSGYPTLNALKTCGADDLCVVVTRYFGGTLLGTAGLARTYAAAARSAIECAGFAVYESFTELCTTVGYSEYQRLTAMLKNEGIPEDDTEFGEEVTARFFVPSADADRLVATICDMTGGRSRPKMLDVTLRLRKIDIKK